MFAEDLARRAALAIDNADLFSQTQRAAETLQHALLPQRLPGAEGLGRRDAVPAVRRGSRSAATSSTSST